MTDRIFVQWDPDSDAPVVMSIEAPPRATGKSWGPPPRKWRRGTGAGWEDAPGGKRSRKKRR